MRCGAQGIGSRAVEVGAARGGGERPTVVVLPALVLKDEEDVRWAEWAKRPSRLVRRLGQLGQKVKEIPFGIKIRFLDLHGFWKFVQGDLGGILIQRFLLNSSRLLMDF
jgi:hypothetical protein